MARQRHVMICVSGYSGSGKDELVRKLVERGAPKVGLADPAKRHMADIYGFTEEQLFGPSSARNAGDMRFPKADHETVGLAPSNIRAGEAPKELVGELKPETEYWEYVGRSSREEALPYIPGKMGSARILVPEGHPSFWLSPREALQRYCELMNMMYENTWIRKALETHQMLSETYKGTSLPAGRDRLIWGYDRMKGVHSAPAGHSAPGPDDVFVSCSADFRHRHEVALTNRSATEWFIPVLVRVKRPSVPEPPFSHRSETEMKTIPDSAFDYVVDNNGTVEDLHAEAARILEQASNQGWKPLRSRS